MLPKQRQRSRQTAYMEDWSQRWEVVIMEVVVVVVIIIITTIHAAVCILII